MKDLGRIKSITAVCLIVFLGGCATTNWNAFKQGLIVGHIDIEDMGSFQGDHGSWVVQSSLSRKSGVFNLDTTFLNLSNGYFFLAVNPGHYEHWVRSISNGRQAGIKQDLGDSPINFKLDIQAGHVVYVGHIWIMVRPGRESLYTTKLHVKAFDKGKATQKAIAQRLGNRQYAFITHVTEK